MSMLYIEYSRQKSEMYYKIRYKKEKKWIHKKKNYLKKENETYN